MTNIKRVEQWNLPAGCVPYVLRAGDSASSIVFGQAVRIQAGEAQTNGAFTICTVVGPKADPIPQHFHEHEHDTFVCLRGQLQLWTDEESRVLTRGGFGNVPPGVKHGYAMRDHHTELVGLISPGGFERFFAETGWSFDSSGYPVRDDAMPSPELIAEVGKKYDVHFVPGATYVDASANDGDTALPGSVQPYFLRPGAGERRVFGSIMATAMCRGAETNGRFGMCTLEGAGGATAHRVAHSAEHNVLFVIDGVIDLTLGDEKHQLYPGDTANIPAGTPYGLRMTGGDNRILVFSEADIMWRLYDGCGTVWDAEIYPDTPTQVDLARVEATFTALGIARAEPAPEIGGLSHG
jgi:quercetin dioxygenase-like cupin family protein